jgi:predicted RNA-binding protein with PIN domain
MSVYLIDGYNLLHQIVAQRDSPGGSRGRRRSGRERPVTVLQHGTDAQRGSRTRSGAQHGTGTDAPDDRGHGTGTVADLEDERRRLLDRIASFMGGTSDRAIVVFDSRTQMLQKSESATAQVDVYFGSFSQSADSIIEREVYALSAGENVIVVSSDYQLQKTIFVPNVVRMSSRQFAAELQDDTQRIANHQKCITISPRIEDRIPTSTFEKLARLRDELEQQDPDSEGRPRFE